MTKEELIRRILEYEIPVQERQLKAYSHDRLTDYLRHLEVMGHKRGRTQAEHAGRT